MLRVLTVDDSPAARRLLAEILASDPEIQIVGHAGDGVEAIEATRRLRPDVITMDIVMPRMGGVEAIRSIMSELPTPIVVVTARDPAESWVFDAMEAGALTVLVKPDGPRSPSFDRQASQLVATVKLVAAVRAVRHPRRGEDSRDVDVRSVMTGDERGTPRDAEVVAVAASTGGPAALAHILRELPGDLPVPVLVVQHIAPGFEHGLAKWLTEIGSLSVRVAAAGEQARPGAVLLAASGAHLGITRSGKITVSNEGPIGGFRPSATFLFRSVARAYGRRALGVVLTGMGSDGAAGLVDLRRAGAYVIAQDEATSSVYGMPGAAVAAGATDCVLPIRGISGAIAGRCHRA
jgi:two-component system chemotaxis response regulator CheB